MSVLEFIAAIKWPVTLLILATAAMYTLRRSPEARASFNRHMQTRNWRIRIAGQEVEGTLIAAQPAMTAAVLTDDQLAAELVRRFREEQQSIADLDLSQYRLPTDNDIETTRREAVESVMRTAARWGWDMAHRELRQLPELDIEWTNEGRPEISIGVREVRFVSPSDLFAPALSEMARRAACADEQSQSGGSTAE